MWMLAPNAMGLSNIGVKGNEPIGAGWSFVFNVDALFNPYSLRLADAPGSVSANINGPIDQRL